MEHSDGKGTGRRQFLGSSAAAGLLILKPETVFGSQANSTVELGLIGCGGRGNWIAPFFKEYTGARITALADAFAAPLEETRQKLGVESARAFSGLDGHRRLIASGIDAVVIETPPYFHPEHAEAAVAAGKHVYLAKPVAVDVSGCQRIAAAGERAKGKVSFLVDFQTRAQPVFQEAATRVHRGDIGDIVLGHIYYHAGRVKARGSRPGAPDGERLGGWLHDKVLSGDIIVEQNVHVLDAGNWYLKSHPLKAAGVNGRKARLDGDVSDHFVVTYWYPNDVKVDFSSAQFLRGYGDLCIRVYGSAGTVDSHYNGLVRITGDKPWNGTEKDDTFRQGAVTNVKNFVDSIRTGKYLNNTGESVNSTLTAVLGRMAAYKGRMVTWDEMMNSGEKYEVSLKI